MGRMATAGCPLRVEHGRIRLHTTRLARAALTLREGPRGTPAAPCAGAHAHLPGHPRHRPPLLPQGAGLLVLAQALGPTGLPRGFRPSPRRGVWRHGAVVRRVRLGQGAWQEGLSWGGERGPRQRRSHAERGFARCAERLHEMPASRDWHGVWGPLGHPGGLGCGPLPCHHRHLGVGLQPGGDRLGGAVLEPLDRTAPVQSHHDGARGVPLPFGPIVEANGTGPWSRWRGKTPAPAQERLPAARYALPGQVSSTRCAPERQARRGLERGHPRGRPRGVRGDLGDTLGARLAPAGWGRTPEAADTQRPLHGGGRPRQIGPRTPIITMPVRRRLGTGGTEGLGGGDRHVQRQPALGHGPGFDMERGLGWYEVRTEVRTCQACAPYRGGLKSQDECV